MSWGSATVYFHRKVLSRDAEIVNKPNETTSNIPTDDSVLNITPTLVVGDFVESVYNSSNNENIGKVSGRVSSIKFLLYTIDLSTEGSTERKETFKDIPIVIFLHGASARGQSTSELKQTALLSLVDGMSTYLKETEHQFEKALILAPLCPAGIEWKNEQMCSLIIQLLEFIVKSYEVDRHRIYLTGISMGGLGSWMLAAR
jgi:predicted peptidase